MEALFKSLDHDGSNEYLELLRKLQKNPAIHIIKPVNNYLEQQSRTVEQSVERIYLIQADKKRKADEKADEIRVIAQLAEDTLNETNRLLPYKSASDTLKGNVNNFIAKVAATRSPRACTTTALEEEVKGIFESCCTHHSLLSLSANSSGCLSELSDMSIAIKGITELCASTSWATQYRNLISSSGPSLASV